MSTKYYIDSAGQYIGGFDGVEPPQGSTEVSSAPSNASASYVDGNWVLPLSSYMHDIETLYALAMQALQNGYSDEEVKTFPYKKTAAEAILGGTASNQQKYLLAHRKGFVNSAVPNQPDYLDVVASEVASMTEAQNSIILNDARKILAAAYTFDHFSSLIEDLRDKAVDSLVESQDNASIVDGLSDSYEALKNA